MPKLSRIRIANVSYDGKYIMDQMYDTRGGENTLFNLANGSGKSVLVQMMMQPILPNQRIHDRRIESYLSKSSSPTYIMLEWKLDHTVKPIYYLTGIAMCSIPQSDESIARVKYFTFTHKYDIATEYDIAHTPLIQQSGGGYRYMPYDEAYALLRNVKSDLRPLNCYTRERKEAYLKDLGEHGIFEKEWTLLAKVNNKEGGVDEVFAGCKSSDALLDKWILQTVSEKIGFGEQNLRDMFFSLISSVLAQEETILEKELLTDFLQEVGRLIESISGLLGQLDSIRQIEGFLAGLYRYLSRRTAEIDDEKLGCDEEELKLDEAKKRIRYEQLSESWHNANDKLLLLKEKLDECEAITDRRRTTHEQAKREREIMTAAEHKEKLNDALNNIAARMEQLKRLDEGLQDQDAQDVLFSLDKCYTDMIAQNMGAIQGIVNEIESAEDLLKLHKGEIAKIGEDRQELSKTLGILEEKIASFAVYEADCQKKLGISIHRTLARELSEDELESARKFISEKPDKLSRLENELTSRLKADSEKRADLARNMIKLTEELGDTDNRIAKLQEELKQYEKAEGMLKEIAERWGMPADVRGIPDNLRSLRESELQRKAELSNWNFKLAQERDTLARFNANSLHTSPAFGKLLQSGGIDYITGEDYLKGKGEDEQKEILSKNPMLPFCFLVGRSDFEKAAALSIGGIDRVCPILILEKAEEDMGAVSRAVSLTDFGRALCYYYEESFAPDKKEAFRVGLEEAIAQSEKSCAEWNAEITLLGKDIDFLEAFPYDSNSGQELSAKTQELQSQRQAIIEKRGIEEGESENLEKTCESLRDEIGQCQKNRERAESNVRLFDEYLSKDAEFAEDIVRQHRQERKKEELDRRYGAISDAIDELNSMLSSAGIRKSTLSNQTEELKRKHREISAPESGRVLDWPLIALEKRYEEIKYNQTQEKKIIEQQLLAYREKKSDAEKSLSRYKHISEHEMERVSYDEDRLELLEKDETRKRQQLTDAEKDQEKARDGHVRAEAEVNSCSNRLRDEGCDEPLAVNEIIGDYDARSASINERLKEIGLRKRDLDNERDTCRLDISRIINIIGDSVNSAPPHHEEGRPAVDIDEQHSKHKEAASAIEKLRGELYESEREIKSVYNQKHSGIDHMLKGLTAAQYTLDYEACYFAFERLTGQRNLMLETVRVLESRLEHLDNQKENVVYHAFAQGKRLYFELRQISESSRVRLNPDKPPRQTLKIGVPDELDAFAEDRVREHVNACIADLRREKKESGLIEKKMRDFISSKLSDREILNQVVGQHSINVQLLKVDAFYANTRLRTWESVLTDNSGGELFVSCFVLLSALMDYSRKSILTEDKEGSGAKVMLIDNPFGKTSSTHLLDALIQVAKQFDMQMICLSDLSQSSITAKFSLIYQLSLRPALYGGKSYLKTDSVSSNLPPDAEDSRLEHVSLRSEQLSMFG